MIVPWQARSDASKVSKEWLEHLADITKTPTSQLKFINEAWNQVGQQRLGAVKARDGVGQGEERCGANGRMSIGWSAANGLLLQRMAAALWTHPIALVEGQAWYCTIAGSTP